jgi:hypothetical protein
MLQVHVACAIPYKNVCGDPVVSEMACCHNRQGTMLIAGVILAETATCGILTRVPAQILNFVILANAEIQSYSALASRGSTCDEI